MLTDSEFPHWLSWLAYLWTISLPSLTPTPLPSPSLLPALALQKQAALSGFYVGWDPNLGPNACRASTLPMKPSPSPPSTVLALQHSFNLNFFVTEAGTSFIQLSYDFSSWEVSSNLWPMICLDFQKLVLIYNSFKHLPHFICLCLHFSPCKHFFFNTLGFILISPQQ